MTDTLRAIGLAIVAIVAIGTVGVTAAQATTGAIEWEAGATKLTAEAEGPQVFSITGKSLAIECDELAGKVELPAGTSATEIQVENLEYKNKGKVVCPGSVEAEVRMNGCKYVFHAGAPLAAEEVEALADLICPGTSTVEIGSGASCLVKIGTQKGLKGVTIATVPGATERLTITAHLTGIKYTHNGTCTETEDDFGSDGTYDGAILVNAENGSAVAKDVTVAPQNGISYDKTATKVTATQDATAPNQVFKLTGGAVTVTCNEYHATANLDGTGKQTTIETSEMAYAHNGTNLCGSNIEGFNPKIEMNGCDYRFHAGNTVGTLENMEIEATMDILGCTEGTPYVTVNGGGVCTLRVFGNTLNQGITGIKIKTITGGAKEDLTLEANVTGLHATHTGGCAFFGDKTTTEGTYNGKVTITAEDNSAVQKDITVT